MREQFLIAPWKSSLNIYLLLHFLSNHPETFRICSKDHLEEIVPANFWDRPLKNFNSILKILDLEKSSKTRLISRNSSFAWPPYSPDLNPPDFFLWGYLKSKVYTSPYPKTAEELKRNIVRECRKITKEVIQSAVNNFNTRMQFLLAKKRAWFEQILNF